ncbi:alpha/beta-hydrolase [Gracilaria domingensis]|nr:alpha/beta-hydrolase [Gracilaria domingensis]
MLGVVEPRHDSTAPRQHALSTLPPTLPFDIWSRRNFATSFRNDDAHPSPIAACEPWITAFLIIGFDLDKGQVVEACVPNNVLTYAEKEAICYYAMPDSAAGGTGHEDALYTFRVARDSEGIEEKMLLAHTLFRQAPDKSNPRGFFQKAVVVVTSTPFITLASVLLTSLASKAFADGEKALFRAVEDVSSWPDPRAHNDGRTLELPFVDETVTMSVPDNFLCSFAAPDAILMVNGIQSTDNNSLPKVSHVPRSPSRERKDRISREAGLCTPDLVRMWPLSSSSAKSSAQPFHEVNLAYALQGVYEKLWSIWELVVIGEPLLVLGATPSECASAVLCIIGIIHPLPFVGDWRPYYCIQDSTYMELMGPRKNKMMPDGAVYGVTNSHLVDTLPFEHVLVLPGSEVAGKHHRPGLRSSHRSAVYKARQITNGLLAARAASVKGGANADQLSLDLRDVIFEKITKPFLGVFDRYLVPCWSDGTSLTDEPNVSDPFGRHLTLADFEVDKFPTSEDLCYASGNMGKGSGNPKRMRGLYERFVRGPVFREWWQEARKVAERQCQGVHRQLMIEACSTGRLIRKADQGRKHLADLTSRVEKELQLADKADRVLVRKLRILADSLRTELVRSVGESIDNQLDNESAMLLV